MKKLIIGAALALAIPSMALAANVAGTWAIQLATDMGSMGETCTLTQTDNTLGGTCGANPATGTVAGDDVTVAYDTDFQGTMLHVVYTGHVGADGALSGTFSATPPGGATPYTGNFTGVRGSGPSAASPSAPSANPPVANASAMIH